MGSLIFAEAARQWLAMREEFALVVQAAYERAEAATNAVLLNAEGRAAGVDSFSLFTGPYSRVKAYASPELIEHFRTVSRPCLERFEREWLAARQGWPDDATGGGELLPSWLESWETDSVGRAA